MLRRATDGGLETQVAGRAGISPIALPAPYLLFLGDTVEPGYAKTAYGLRDWAPERCVGEYALAGATVTTGLPMLQPREAFGRGARALLIGVATPGGLVPKN